MYLDTEGNRTVGVGFNLERLDAPHIVRNSGANYRAVLDGTVALTPEQVDYILDYTVREAVNIARTLVSNYEDLSDVRKRVVVDMAFNLGERGLSKFVSTIGHIEKEEWEDAAQHMVDSLWYKQTKSRARRLVKMMKTGVDYEL